MAATAATVLPRFAFGQSGGKDTLKVGICGLGGRGVGAALDALMADDDVKITALADLFQVRIDRSCAKFEGDYFGERKARFDVPKNRRYVGTDCLDQMLAHADIDVVLLCTPPVFRAEDMKKCLEAGKHVFAEKPLCVDPTAARFIEEEVIPLAEKKGLSMMGGNQARHDTMVIEALDRLHDGQIGEIVNVKSIYYWHHYIEGPQLAPELTPEQMEFQIRRWIGFIWASGDQLVEQHIHALDLALWAMGDISPLSAMGFGGRDPSLIFGQQGNRFSHAVVDYDFGKNRSLMSLAVGENGGSGIIKWGADIYGTKGTLILRPGAEQEIVGEQPWKSDVVDESTQIKEQRALYRAIREGRRIDAIPALLHSNRVAILGREACYSGKRISYNWLLKSKQNLFPEGKIDLSATREIAPVPTPSTYRLV